MTPSLPTPAETPLDQAGAMAGHLTRGALRRRVTVLVFLLSIIVVGIVATTGIPLELFPRGYTGQNLRVFVPWQDAPVQEVLHKITLPLEEELGTVRGLDGLNSFSSKGSAGLFLRFKRGTDMDVAYREVRDRVERARLLFPSDVDRVFIRKEDASGIPVAVIGFAIDPGMTDAHTLIKKTITQRLERIDGVASVRTDGLEEKEILIEVDRQLAESTGLNLYQLIQELGADNFTLASGHVREADRKLLLRSVAQYNSIDELENRPLSPTVRLKDVARVRYEEPEKRYSVRVNSRPAAALVVLKEGEANTVEVSRRVRAEFERIRQDPRLAHTFAEILFDQGQVVEESLDNLVSGGLLGAVLAAAVLFGFLGRIRLTVIITLSIPISLLIALATMFFAGESLNILTILALVIAVGMLVDNSIVVAENIHRLHLAGHSRAEACIRGAAEIALAIALATLTTVIVFVPAALVEGEGQFFLVRLALPVSVALLASLLVALVFIPLSVYLTLPRHTVRHDSSPWRRAHDRFNSILSRLYDRSLGATNRAYVAALSFFVAHRLDLVILLASLFAASYFGAAKRIEFVRQQEEDQTQFKLGVEASNEYGFEELADYFREVESVLAAHQNEFGLKGYFVFFRPRFGSIEGWFHEPRRSDKSVKEIAKALLDLFPKKPGIRIFQGEENRAEESKSRAVFAVHLEGDEASELEDVATRIEPLFLATPGVLGVRKGEESAPSEMALRIDRDRAASAGVNPEVIAGLVGYALRGSQLPKYNDAGHEIPVRIRFREADRETMSELGGFQVPTSDGSRLTLDALTDRQVQNSPRGIFRRDKKTTRTLTFELLEKDARVTRDRLQALQGRLALPEGVTFGSSFYQDDRKEMMNMAFAAGLSVIFIYLLMAFLFESLILPLSVVLTIPLAGIGVVWTHVLTGKDIDFLGAVGVILLIGVVVNNGIVLVDYVNRLRLDGHERGEALLLAADRRFRPILMTALTTIIGMVPLTLSAPSQIGLSYKSFGLTLIGGMTTATFLTLLVVPVFYTFFDDLRLYTRDALIRFRFRFGLRPHPTRSDR